MDRRAMVRCPYCGMENPVIVTDDYREKQIVCCDLEGGGCDCDFVAAITVSINTKALKIEGEEPMQPVEAGKGETHE